MGNVTKFPKRSRPNAPFPFALVLLIAFGVTGAVSYFLFPDSSGGVIRDYLVALNLTPTSIRQGFVNTGLVPGCRIKGNVSINTGERIYHVPGRKY